MNFDLSDAPAQPAPRRPAVYPWGRQWFTTFSAVFAAVLAVQVLNIIVGWMLFKHITDKFAEGMRRPAAAELKK